MGEVSQTDEAQTAEGTSEPEALADIAAAFRHNTKALRVFSDRIAQAADEHDERLIQGFASSLESIFGPRAGNETPTATSAGESTAEGDEEAGISDDKEAEIRDAMEDPETRQRFMDATFSFVQSAPVQGQILRQGALVTLVSYFEGLVSDLIHSYYLRYPDALPASDRSLTLAEIRAVGSITEAERYIISREAETVLRESLDQQIEYFGKRPSLDLDPLNARRPWIIEIGQRRNLFVHNRAVVNRLYLSRVPFEQLGTQAPDLGAELHADSDYLRRAIDTVEVVGTILLDLAWRKWDKQAMEDADHHLLDVVYQSLRSERYTEVIQLAEYGRGLRQLSEASSRVLLVNHAIALQKTDQSQRAADLLNEKDWSATAPRFKVAVAALNDDIEGVLAALPVAVAADEISEMDVKEWPLLESARKDERFVSAVANLFESERDDQVGGQPD